jgi:hypothetical protein
MDAQDPDAIQPDVPGKDNPEAIPDTPDDQPDQPNGDDPKPERVSPRQEAMNRIVELRTEDEIAEVEELAGQSSLEEPESLTVKVDGVEQQLPIDEAKAVIQKNLAADKRLNEASLKQQQLQQWEQNLIQREKQQIQAPPVDPVETHGDEGELKERVQTAVDKLYDGDTDEAVEALTGIIGGRNQATPINTNAIVAQAKEAVLQEQRQREFNQEVSTARNQFNTEFKELAEDPELMDFADQKTISLMKEHPDWAPTQVIMEAGRHTQEWVNKIRGNGDSGQASRMERKANLKPMPRSNSSLNYQIKPPKEEKMTTGQVLSQMREARGQA